MHCSCRRTRGRLWAPKSSGSQQAVTVTSRSNALLSSRNTCTQVPTHMHTYKRTHTESLNKMNFPPTRCLQTHYPNCRLAAMNSTVNPFSWPTSRLGSRLFLVQLKSSFSFTWLSSAGASPVLAPSKEGHTNTNQTTKEVHMPRSNHRTKQGKTTAACLVTH